MTKKSLAYLEIQRFRDAENQGWECMESYDNSYVVYKLKEDDIWKAKIYIGSGINPKHEYVNEKESLLDEAIRSAINEEELIQVNMEYSYLEIQVSAMKNNEGEGCLIEYGEKADYYDVELLKYTPETGGIDELQVFHDLTSEESKTITSKLENKYPNAALSINPIP